MATEISLDRFQNWMQAVILHPSDSDEEALASEEAQALIPAQIAHNFIVPSRTLDSLERIGLYRRMYIYRLVEVMGNDYPSVSHFLGDRGFYLLICDYLQAHQSKSYSLNPLGDHFPEFIKNQQSIKRREFLSELAQLELAVSKVFDAPESPVLGKEAIAALSPEQWETAKFKFIDAFQLLEFRYPVNDYFQSVMDDDHNHNTRRKDSWVMVYRNQYQVWRLPLTRPSHQLLSALLAGKTLVDAIDEVVSSSPKRANSLQKQIFGWFQEWVSEGIFQAIE